MITSGAQLIASGVYTTHLLEDLKRPGRRRWRNLVAWLFALVWLVTLPSAVSQSLFPLRQARAGLRISLAMEK
jgi:hypothetical protein